MKNMVFCADGLRADPHVMDATAPQGPAEGPESLQPFLNGRELDAARLVG